MPYFHRCSKVQLLHSYLIRLFGVWELTRVVVVVLSRTLSSVLVTKEWFSRVRPQLESRWTMYSQCRGDASIRLWDIVEQRSFGGVITEKMKLPGSIVKCNCQRGTDQDNECSAKDSASTRHECSWPRASIHHTTWAGYRGHAPNTPVWSFAFAPNGYYMASDSGSYGETLDH